MSTPLELKVHPGANGSATLYEDDGRSFNYRRGEWMGVKLTWEDPARTLTLQLQPSSRMLGHLPRRFVAKLGDQERAVTWDGSPLHVRL